MQLLVSYAVVDVLCPMQLLVSCAVVGVMCNSQVIVHCRCLMKCQNILIVSNVTHWKYSNHVHCVSIVCNCQCRVRLPVSRADVSLTCRCQSHVQMSVSHAAVSLACSCQCHVQLPCFVGVPVMEEKGLSSP